MTAGETTAFKVNGRGVYKTRLGGRVLISARKPDRQGRWKGNFENDTWREWDDYWSTAGRYLNQDNYPNFDLIERVS